MGFLEIFLIAISLSMDAFAISICLGLNENRKNIFCVFIPGLYFGFFQALMPLIGFYAGTLFADQIQNLDHWIAFILLGLIGAKMIKDGLSKKETESVSDQNKNPFACLKMLMLALATSIDALAVGITFSFFRINIFSAIIITGITTFCISTIGVFSGKIFGEKFKSRAEIFGGLVLILLGVKILLEHLFYN